MVQVEEILTRDDEIKVLVERVNLSGPLPDRAGPKAVDQ